jgi:TatD DNase family protein
MTAPLPEPAAMPRLDAHAHLAPDVTPTQVRALGDCHVFAVTRTLEEAAHVRSHPAPMLTWGLGAHPGVAASRDRFSTRTFAQLLPHFSLVGEIGLHRRAGHLDQQTANLREILRICADHPVLLSIHSSGLPAATLCLLAEQPHPGVILHWWSSNERDLDDAIASGAYFSVNAAMNSSVLSRIPADRILTETDFPARKVAADRPGDTARIEQSLADIHTVSAAEIRRRVWVNLRRLAIRAHALDRLPDALADRLLSI